MARAALLILLVFFFPEVKTSGGFVERKLEKEFKELLKKNDGPRVEEIAGLFEGDIDMEENMKRALIGGKISTRDALIMPTYHWPDGRLYYRFHSSINGYTRHQIYQAMDHIEKYTCVTFEEYDDQPLTNYVVFFQGRGCFSRVGRSPFRISQTISIGLGCTRLGTIVHEIMHALGFFHEQSRPDRDNFIKIIWSNIIKKHVHNFRKYSTKYGSSLGKPYDYLSVMHYPRYAFSKNEEQTIVPRKKDVHIGQRYGLSFFDAYQINKLYKCHPDRRSRDHKGYCFPEVPASEGTKSRCTDRYHPFFCEHLKNKGYCHKYFLMRLICRRTCTNCGHKGHRWMYWIP